jgi:hypothetical protein
MLALAMSAPTTIRAEAPGKVDMEAAEAAVDLIGARSSPTMAPTSGRSPKFVQ